MHRSILGVVLVCFMPAFAPVPALQAECPTGDYVVSVEPGRPGRLIYKSSLLAAAPGFQIIGSSRPSFGELTENAGSYLYKPAAQFWTLGTDSFTVHLAPSTGRSTPESVRARTVFLVSALGPIASLADGFEGSLVDSGWIFQDTGGQLQLFNEGPLCGEQSLKIRGHHAGSWLSTVLDLDDITGGGQQGSGAQATIRPPGSGGPPGNFQDPQEMAFFSTGRPGGTNHHLLWWRDSGASLEIRAEIPGVASTPWIAISRNVHHFQLVYWKRNDRRDRQGGAFLWLDGALVAKLTAPGIDDIHPEFKFGSLESAGWVGGSSEIDLDNVYLFVTDLDRPSFLCRAADGFEGQQIGEGWRSVPAGFSATAAAALDGSSGLEVRVEEAAQLMETLTPTQNGRYGVRFRLDPNTVGLSPGGQLLLFEVLADNCGTPVSCRKPISLVLEVAEFSGYRLRALSQDDNGSFFSTPPLPLSDAPHTLVVDWQRATGEGAPTGSLRLWIDGALAGELTGLASFGQEIAEAHLGALLLEGTASGTVYLDQFEAWRGILP